MFESTTGGESPDLFGQEESMADQTEQETPSGEESEQGEAESDQDEGQETQPPQPTMDYEKAYRNLMPEFTRKSQELSALRKQLDQYTAPPQGQGQPDPDAYWQALQNDPWGTTQAIAEQAARAMVAPLYEQQAQATLARNLETLAKSYPQVNNDMAPLYNKVAEIVAEMGVDPESEQSKVLLKCPPPRMLKMAAQELYGESTAKVYQQAKEKGREEAMSAIQQKQGLAVRTGTKPQTTPKTPEEQYADYIIGAGRRGGVFG